MEIIWVSLDQDETSFNEYYGTMPWLTVPFVSLDVRKKVKTRKTLSQLRRKTRQKWKKNEKHTEDRGKKQKTRSGKEKRQTKGNEK